MPPNDDIALLCKFAEQNSEDAFATLVARYIGLVHSVALRQTGNPHAAEEITQGVFIILARKAGSLGSKVVLAGWLYQTARLTAANYLRTEIRRARREQEVYMQSTLNEPDATAWQQIAPLLDTVMGDLSQADRNAIVLRFFENKSMGEIAAALDAPEATVRKRVTRAVERLRKFFTKRGVTLSATVIAAAVSANSVQAAPTGLAFSTVAAAKGTVVTASTLTLVEGVLKLMTWTKTKVAVVSAVIVLAGSIVTPLAVNSYKEHRQWMWRVQEPTEDLIRKATPQVTIVSTKFQGARWVTAENGFIGIAQPARIVVGVAYGMWGTRVIENTPLPMGRYDFIANPTGDREEAFRAAIKKQFGVVAHREKRPMDVLFLRVKTSDAPGLMPSQPSSAYSERQENGEYILTHGPIGRLEGLFGFYFEKPVINQTGLNGLYDFRLKVDWKKRDSAAVKKDLLDQLGLELIPSREPLDMLIVESAKD